MEKTVFKKGDKVFHIEYGWGEVIEIRDVYSFPVVVNFGNEHIRFSNKGKELPESLQPLLSFTEYTLQGFSQERPIEFPEVGEEVMASDNSGEWYICEFVKYIKKQDYPYLVKINTKDYAFKYIKRLR
jgi:hypothetical protein